VPILSRLRFLCSNSNNFLIISLNSINSFLNLFLNPNSCLYTDTSISLIILRSYLIFAWSNLFLFHSLSNNFLIFLTKFQRPPILFSRKSLILLSYLLFNMSLCCNPRWLSSLTPASEIIPGYLRTTRNPYSLGQVILCIIPHPTSTYRSSILTYWFRRRYFLLLLNAAGLQTSSSCVASQSFDIFRSGVHKYTSRQMHRYTLDIFFTLRYSRWFRDSSFFLLTSNDFRRTRVHYYFCSAWWCYRFWQRSCRLLIGCCFLSSFFLTTRLHIIRFDEFGSGIHEDVSS